MPGDVGASRGVDWNHARQDVIATLQHFIRFRTVNPPGNELPLAEYMRGRLDRAGVETTLLIPAPGRAALFGRIPGAGRARAVLLVAHMDVVSVEESNWTVDPFGGEIRDGYLYGRGAIDDKGMLAANLIAMITLREQLDAGAIALDRDVLFVATSDEEAGGEWGMQWLVDNHPELLDAEFAINEGGRTRIMDDGRRYMAIQTSEKISHVLTLDARGPAGHAAVPVADNAIYQLARALAALSTHVEPLTLTPTTLGFFSQLAVVWPDERESAAMREITSRDSATVAKAGAVLSETAVFNAVLRNGISPSLLGAGARFNVIPAEASATLNLRTLPGQPLQEALARIRAVVAKATGERVSVELRDAGPDAPASDPASVMFQAIATAARELDHTLAVVPYLSTGVTDSARLRRLGVQAYGILPFPMRPADEARMHGHDERVPIESVVFGMRVIYEAVRHVASVAAHNRHG